MYANLHINAISGHFNALKCISRRNKICSRVFIGNVFRVGPSESKAEVVFLLAEVKWNCELKSGKLKCFHL